MPSGAALRREHVEHRRDLRRDLDLDLALLELSVEQQLLELVARALVAVLRRVDGFLGDGAGCRDEEHAERVVTRGRRRRGAGVRLVASARPAAAGVGGGGGSSRSSRRSSTRSCASSSTSVSRSLRTMSIALSTRSRTIDSTSRPT